MSSLLSKLRRIIPLSGVYMPPFNFFKRIVHRRRLAAYRRALAARGKGLRVIVAMNLGVGNAIEATPLVQAIRMLWSDAELSLYAPPGDLLTDWCAVDRIIRNPEELNGLSFDQVFLPLGATLPPFRTEGDRGKVHQTEVYSLRLIRPEREYDLDIARRCGYSGVTPPLYVSLREPGISIPPGGTRVCFCPGGKAQHLWRHKRWPYYADLADTLLAEYDDMLICILGSKDDAMTLNPAWGNRVHDLRGKLSLSETAWILKHSDLAVGNDCGPMHIADAVLTPSIAIFGPTCEVKNGPMNRAAVVSANVACRPCQYTSRFLSCENPICMTQLRAEKVSESVGRMLRVGVHSAPARRGRGEAIL